MKKLISLLIVTTILLLSINTVAMGFDDTLDTVKDENIHYIISINELENTSRASGTKTGTKTITASNDDGEKLWEATIKASFSYTGSSAKCTSASITYNVYDSLWKITSATTTKSSNKAIGNIISKRYLLGIPVQTIERSITLSCSATGVLS